MTKSDLLNALHQTEPVVLIEDRGRSVARLFVAPIDVITAATSDEVESALQRLDAHLAGGRWIAGYLSYEFGLALEPRLRSRLDAHQGRPALCWLGVFEAPVEIALAELDAMLGDLAPPPPVTGLTPNAARDEHIGRVARALDLIRAGDIYQVNLTHPLDFDYEGDPLALYAALRSRQSGAHAALVRTPELDILSASPELFVEVSDGVATVRPMKGTAPRGADPASDTALKEALRADPKQRAENLMIVDLMRNDLSRLAEPGGVKVPAIFQVETYPTLHTLTSTVQATLKPDVATSDVLRALFPCGSITGAPKVRAMEIIGDLETYGRGPYTGAIGHFSPGGELRLNVAIRTAVLEGGQRGRYAVGGGVVFDSHPHDEFEESLLKGRILTDLAAPYGLIETFAWRLGTGFVRLDGHLRRLARSATALEFQCDMEALVEQLHQIGAVFDEDQRVRVQLERDGQAAITFAPLGPEPDSILRLGRGREPVHPGDPFLRHKTTRRDTYERAHDEAAAAGLDDAILVNTRGDVCETTRANLFVEIDGQVLTPALVCGLLPGVLRAEMIESGAAVEAVLGWPDLETASRVWVGNSLRGLRVATLG
ncbi:MAG: aminodeoxychorismate synthase component I [Pseudomonadota bacterium]|jgi:para-aminobenzoate synthetase/4-amino-4-deoxychorismate lyase